MHFRLGDYKFKQEFHPILKKDYYINALNYILPTFIWVVLNVALILPS